MVPHLKSSGSVLGSNASDAALMKSVSRARLTNFEATFHLIDPAYSIQQLSHDQSLQQIATLRCARGDQPSNPAMDSGDPATTQADASAAAEVPVVFRGKKRKFFRQKPAEEAPVTEANEPAAATETEGTPKVEASEPDEEGLSVAEIIRRRNARKHRLKGVGFGADEASAAAQADDELSIMIREEEQKAMELSNGGVNTRFTAQTGLSSDLVNKHMYVFEPTSNPFLLYGC